MRVHPDPFALRLGPGHVLGLEFAARDAAVEVGAGELRVFDAAAVAVEGHAHALARTETGQRVGEHRSRTVAHVERERIVDGDVGPEDVLVADVARVLLGLEVEATEGLGGGEIEPEGILLRGGAGVAVVGGQGRVAAPQGVFPAVEGEVAVGEDLPGDRVDPPVDEVEVVGRLVHEQAAGVLHPRMPAAEVVGAVTRIEQVLQVDRLHVADDARGNELLHLGAVGAPAVVEGHAHAPAGLAHRVEDEPALGVVDRHRLLRNDVAAGAQRAHDVVVMGGVLRANEHDVGLERAHHLVKALRRPGRDRRVAPPGEALVVVRHARGAHIAEREQLVVVTVGRDHRFEKRDGATAGADEDVTFFAHEVQNENNRDT